MKEKPIMEIISGGKDKTILDAVFGSSDTKRKPHSSPRLLSKIYNLINKDYRSKTKDRFFNDEDSFRNNLATFLRNNLEKNFVVDEKKHRKETGFVDILLFKPKSDYLIIETKLCPTHKLRDLHYEAKRYTSIGSLIVVIKVQDGKYDEYESTAKSEISGTKAKLIVL